MCLWNSRCEVHVHFVLGAKCSAQPPKPSTNLEMLVNADSTGAQVGGVQGARWPFHARHLEYDGGITEAMRALSWPAISSL